MIGSAAALMLLGLGRIAGVSGHLFRSLGIAASPMDAVGWSFILGLPLGGWLYTVAIGVPEVRLPASFTLILLGGLLVGFGTYLGSGCTSGHGVCGLSRGSPRSLVATLTFMGTGMLTVAGLRVLGWLA